MTEKYIDKLVSVVIPTYKRSNTLERAIKSVLNQTYSNLELLIVNDNIPGDYWSEQVRKTIKLFNDKRIKLIVQKNHINGAVARNLGIKESKGEYIAFLDDDDYWELEKLERQLMVLNNLDLTWGAVSCLKIYYKDGLIHKASLPYKDGYIFTDVLFFLTNITTGTILMRHEALDDSGYFDENLVRQQDVQLFANFTKKYKIKLIDKHMLNIDVSDNINRPKIEHYYDIKLAYFKSVEALFDSSSNLYSKRIKFHLRANLSIQLIKNGKYFKGLIYYLSCLSNLRVFYRESIKNIKLICEKIFCKFIIKHYRGKL